MFCSKCGENIDEGIKFCPKCGNPINEISQDREDVIGVISVKEKNKRQGRIVGIVIVAVIVALAGILMKQLFLKSPEDIAILACETRVEGNIDKYYKLLAPPYLEYMVGPEGWLDTDEDLKSILRDDAKEFRYKIEYNCGVNFKGSYKVDNVERCDNETLEEVRVELKNFYDYDATVQDAVNVTVIMDFSGEGETVSYSSEIPCVKISGKWYIHSPGFDAF